MFNLACVKFLRAIQPEDFEPDGCFTHVHISPTCKSLPPELVNEWVEFCNNCGTCMFQKNKLIFQLKRFLFSQLGYLVCLRSHHPEPPMLCIRVVKESLTAKQEKISRHLFGRVLQQTCTQAGDSVEAATAIFDDPLQCLTSLPSLASWPLHYFDPNHLLDSQGAFLDDFYLSTELCAIVNDKYYVMFKHFSSFEDKFLSHLREYLCHLLGLTIYTVLPETRKLSWINPVPSPEQERIYSYFKMHQLLMPECQIELQKKK